MTKRRVAAGLAGVLVLAGSTTLLPTAPTTAATPDRQKQVRSPLGAGLGRLVAESKPSTSLKRSAGGFKLNQDKLAIRDDQGRVLVHLTPQADASRPAFRAQAKKLGLDVQAVDTDSGTLEGFVPLSKVKALAAMEETGTIAQALKPQTHVGDATSQGVALQRADRVQARGVDGKGITVGALSDSYDAAVTNLQDYGKLKIHAKQDVASGDLPGKHNKRYPQPVVVLEDLPKGDPNTDEGRAMLQIVHDVAPGSKLCFATAFTGLLGFADNIRKLADKNGECGADVVVDDVGYLDEPTFSDSPLSDAIDEVAAKGTHYFSSAGNNGVQAAWNAPARLSPAKKALKGTNLDLTDVDPALYDGGLLDMDPGRGKDAAQTLFFGEDGGYLNLQWDDPVDVDGATIGDPYFSDTGEVTDADPEPTFEFTPTADQVGDQVLFRTDGIPSGTTDLILSVDAPDGSNLGTIDTGSSPEQLATTLTQPGTYTITVSGFDGDTGDFTVDVLPVLSPSKVTTDFNILFFDMDGNFLFASSDVNPLSGRPQETPGIDGGGELQIAVSRSGTGPYEATRLRNVLGGSAYFTEYSDPLSNSTTGHTLAKGATGVAAYDPFRSFLPEFFTSQGGITPVFFDSGGNRYPRPQLRRAPQVAAADGGNTTFFAADNPRDDDTQPNFFGTSAAAPHAAAIAALALQRAGGSQAYTPKELRSRLQRSAYVHDLDPTVSKGRAGGLRIKAEGPQGYENYDVPPQSMVDPKFFTLKYSGRVPLKSVTFYGETASPTALGKRNPPLSDGIVFDTRPFDGVFPFRDDGFPFQIGSTSGGLSSSEVSPTFSVPAGGESENGQFRRMTLNFESGLERGQGLQFNVDRDLAVSGFGGSNEGNGADELGGAVFYPQNFRVSRGMVFVGELANGRKIVGAFRNRLGHGYSPVDGFGLINAQKAVLGR